MIKEGTKIVKSKMFRDNDTLEEIIIPDSVVEIEEAAFMNCTALKKVVLPAMLKVLPRSVFSGCTSLSEITIPDSVTVIQDYAFGGCSSLKQLELPENIFVVEPRAFEDAACEGKVTYKGSCRKLFRNTLFAKSSHQKHIEIPEGIVQLEENCFKDYTELETVTLPKSLKVIGTNCFNGCSNLKEIHFNEGMKIGWHSFQKCVSLRTVEIPENCSVGELAFWQCENLNSVRLPYKAELSLSAFYGCERLEVVCAPENSDYHQLFRRLPSSCRVLNLDGREFSGMEMKIYEWDGEVPKEALPEIEKLQGLSLEEQLLHCYIVTTESDESCAYGEAERANAYESRILLKNAYDFEALLVKNGTIIGFVTMDKKEKFLGQIIKSYSSVDADGTGSTYSSSVSRLLVME